MYSGSAEPSATAPDSKRNPDAMWLLALCAAAPEPYPIAQPAGHEGAHEGASVAFRNNCTTNCALLIMLHGLGATFPFSAAIPRTPWTRPRLGP